MECTCAHYLSITVQGVFSHHEESNDLFRYTSSRWLYDEPRQLAERYVKFDVDALKRIASDALGSPCKELTKFREGYSNKVFLLRMQNGEEVLAKIPHPIAGPAEYIVASETATLDFVLPRVFKSSTGHQVASSPNPVGAEYMLMEKVKGRQLADVWPEMPEYERFHLVENIVEIQKKLMAAKLSKYGSIYYRDAHPTGMLTDNCSTLSIPDATTKNTSRFIIGPVAANCFWENGKRDLDIDRGPWNTAEEYFAAVAKREITWIKQIGRHQPQSPTLLTETSLCSPDIHVQLLELYLTLLPYILPPVEEVTSAVLWHEELYFDHIFVDETDRTKITGIIDWQGIYAAPLFMQAGFPAIAYSTEPYEWGTIMPQLPDDYETLSEADKETAKDRLRVQRLKKFYEMACLQLGNPLAYKAMRSRFLCSVDPSILILHLAGRIWQDGPVPFQELLLQIYEKWDGICLSRGLDVACPVTFTEEGISEARKVADKWGDARVDFQSLRDLVLGADGGVSHEDYDEAMAQFNLYRETLEERREQLFYLDG
ncbi:hypothetical protein L228DRAFT_261664 [Xylona heveae TC161]|uniref:Aminoglycoside phosphotransferase domain-containing protein n=1 Tax=Xylona heveae (strain CBS 132557 / TC161) TaxID=1328760 RepID=A0A165FXC2_XYLHT|nr:hypothetical protein L228DRAFT_261664 [Xylona heveae TC161]KZF21497.1 hypothetical protein L228DRAFT_261664 [Xylona heveae TC161]